MKLKQTFKGLYTRSFLYTQIHKTQKPPFGGLCVIQYDERRDLYFERRDALPSKKSERYLFLLYRQTGNVEWGIVEPRSCTSRTLYEKVGAYIVTSCIRKITLQHRKTFLHRQVLTDIIASLYIHIIYRYNPNGYE